MNIQKNISLEPYNTLRIKSTAEYFAFIENVEDLCEARKYIQENNISWRILGFGSNILMGADVITGLTLIMKYQKHEQKENIFTLGAGELLGKVIFDVKKAGFDISVLSGFPSSVGGAIRGNAGLSGVGFGDFLQNAKVFNMETGEIEIWDAKDFQFNYRHSALKDTKNFIFIEGDFIFPEGSGKDNLREYRKSSQPTGKCSGCFFKNPEAGAAGYFIDQAGLKGTQMGDAIISDKHANFFMNVDNAKPQDFMDLIQKAQSEVKKQHGVDIELEVEIII